MILLIAAYALMNVLLSDGPFCLKCGSRNHSTNQCNGWGGA